MYECETCLDLGAIEMPETLPCPDCRPDEHQAAVGELLETDSQG